MSKRSDDHPLATVLTNILEGTAKIRALAYSDEQTFANLWLEGLKEGTHEDATRLILCGAQPPQEAFEFLKRPGMPRVDVSQHFSAYSWAAAFRMINPAKAMRIVIIEGSPHSQAQGAGDDLRKLFDRSSIEGVTSLCFPSLSQIIQAVTEPIRSGLSAGETGMLRGIIQQHLLPNAEDHHKIGNIIGALMLAPHREEGSEILGALFQALESDTSFEKAEVPRVDENLKSRIQPGPPFVLFDDMGLLWEPFVSQWVSKGRLHIPTVDDYRRKTLAAKIKELSARPVQQRRFNASDFGVAPGAVPDGEPFVLLLDLRLFAGDQRDNEATFVDQLKDAAESVAKIPHLKWPAIEADEMIAADKAWYETQKPTPEFRKARSWLPRLISLVDPTLPIVIFSSTQDGAVLREFRACGNIVTDFAKPAFRGAMGGVTDWSGSAVLDFEKAVQAALKIASARSKVQAVCQEFRETARVGEGLPQAAPPPAVAPQPGTSSAKVEIFIDESGTASQKRFALGAVVLISGRNAFNHAEYRKAAVDEKVGLWGLDDVVKIRWGNFPPHPWLKKGKDILTSGNGGEALNSKLREVQELVERQDGRLFACSLISEEPPVPADTTSVRHPFHRYRDMLSRLLEAILFHFEPVVNAIETGANVCVDAAVAKNDVDTWALNSLITDFGAETFDDDEIKRCRTLGKSHVLPLIAGLIVRYGKDKDRANRKEKDIAKRIERARGVQLTNFEECTKNTLSREDRLDPKPIHHLADWIAHFACDEKDWDRILSIPVLKAWFNSGFRQKDEDSFRAQLRCHRRWSQGAKIEAIMRWKAVASGDEFFLTSRLSRNAAQWMEELSGDDLRQLFAQSTG